MEKKRCSHCLEEKSVSDFYRHSRTKDGLQSWCKSCTKKHNDEQHSLHRMEEARYSHDYRKAHPVSCRESSCLYRKRKKSAGGDYSKSDANWCLEFFDYRCAYTGKPLGADYQFDHVVPVSAGGDSNITNLVPCLPTINLSKSSSEIVSWYMRQVFFSEYRLRRINRWCSRNRL